MNQKHEQAMSYKCKCKFDERKCNSNQKWNINILRCGCKNITHLKNIIFGTLLHVVAKIVDI